jgi:hypothetical protein
VRRDRILTLRSSSGVETEFGDLDISIGLGLERDFAKSESQLGIEVVNH